MPVKSVLEVFLPMSARAFPLSTETGDKSRRRGGDLGGQVSEERGRESRRREGESLGGEFR